MRANIVDLRYRTKEILNALDRNEEVVILYRGKEKAVIVPIRKKTLPSVKQHPFFGMLKDNIRPVESIMDDLRGDRYSDV